VASVAQLTGVSVSTVSKVLNGHEGVAAETRRRVEAALSEHGYRRPRVTAPASILDLVFFGLMGDLSTEIIKGVDRVAAESGLAVAVTDTRSGDPGVRAWSQRLLARRPTGIIVVHSRMTPEEHGQLAASGIPLVIIDPMGDPRHATPSVSGTNWSGGVTAAQHVLDLGHRRIAVISGPTELLCARARLEAIRASLDGAGRPLDDRLVRTAHFDFDDGLLAAEELLGLPARPTAVLCGNDLQALGVYEAARRAGLRIPEDLSVVGFDDLPLASHVPPPLTTVHQPFGDMGEVAARMLVSLTAGVRPQQLRVELATSLVVRASTAPPASS